MKMKPTMLHVFLMRSTLFGALLCSIRPTAEGGHAFGGRVCPGLRLRGGDERVWSESNEGNGGMEGKFEENFMEESGRKSLGAGQGGRSAINHGKGWGVRKDFPRTTKGEEATDGEARGPRKWGGVGESMEDMGEDAMFDVGNVDLDDVQDADMPAFQEGGKKKKKRSRRRQDIINRRKDKRGKEGGEGDTEEAWKKVRGAHIGDQEGVWYSDSWSRV